MIPFSSQHQEFMLYHALYLHKRFIELKYILNKFLQEEKVRMKEVTRLK